MLWKWVEDGLKDKLEGRKFNREYKNLGTRWSKLVYLSNTLNDILNKILYFNYLSLQLSIIKIVSN